ncbi:hypothetical protein Leryth_006036 [Lithospermum erythrorhizon]|nr:hypothetical protein Leryth_006036 [Lithospermum erythrorhizon]
MRVSSRKTNEDGTLKISFQLILACGRVLREFDERNSEMNQLSKSIFRYDFSTYDGCRIVNWTIFQVFSLQAVMISWCSSSYFYSN